MKDLLKSLPIVAALTLGVGAADANAALIATIDGNDCAGVFGQGFADCVIPAQYDADQSPIIIKFDVVGGQLSQITLNDALFPTVDGSEFAFDLATNTWMYTPGPGDPVISFFVAKGGPNFNLFSAEDELSDVWATPTNPSNGQPFGLSHLSFYDTDGDFDVPEPASIALLGLGVLVAGYRRRRQ